MKKSIVILLLMLSFVSFAQKDYKLLEQSSKAKPSWLTGGSTQGAFMIQANKVATIDEAQNTVMTRLLNQIASSVAVQVSGEIIEDIDWETVELNGKTQEQYIEQLKINTTTKIAKIPTLQGVSINKADIYWERFLNKKTKEECYDYYILYPFSSFELQELIDAFNAQEKAMNEKIESYRENLDDIDEINVLLESINEMKSLMKQVGEYDPVKSDKLKNYISLYEKVISEIFIEVLENGNGVLVLQLKHDEKVMKTTSLPQVRCDCVKDIKKKHIGNHVKIIFDTFDCYFDQDDNYMTVTFNFGKKKVSKKLIIKK